MNTLTASIRAMLLALLLLLPDLPRAAGAVPSGTVWAWGLGYSGQLGDGTYSNTSEPVRVVGLSDVTAIAAGYRHSLALTSDGSVWAWGSNNEGQLGNGSRTSNGVPARVSGLGAVVGISAGREHSLALTSDGSVWAWGGNDYGQLGDGSTDRTLVPVAVGGLASIVAIAAGEWHSLALSSDRKVWAWGRNDDGRLGVHPDLTMQCPGSRCSWVPVSSGIDEVMAIAAGGFHSLAVKLNGTVWGWGVDNLGQLGDGSSQPYRPTGVPVQAKDLVTSTLVAAGWIHSMAISASGGWSVWAWGDNQKGQLGTGFQGGTDVPVQVLNLPRPTAIAAGFTHSLAVGASGTAWAWGENWAGQLGDGTLTNRFSPVQVKGISQAVAIAGGGSHSLALVEPGPRVDITRYPWGWESANSATFEFQPTVPVSSIECALDRSDEVGFRPCTSPWQAHQLSEGVHVFRVRATDRAGVTGPPTTWHWWIDTTPPTSRIERPRRGVYVDDEPLPGEAVTVVMGRLTVEAVATDRESGVVWVDLFVNGELQGRMSAWGNDRYRFTWTPPSTGLYQLVAVATNFAGLQRSGDIDVLAVSRP